MKINLKKIRIAAFALASSSESKRDAFLRNLVTIVRDRRNRIIRANKKDIEAARKNKLSSAFIQRLILDENAAEALGAKLESILKLRSNLGEVIERRTNEDGLLLKKIRVPLGVLFVIYESRPEVTVDVATLCIKSGNAVILKGGSEAKYTNASLQTCIRDALRKSNLPEETISFALDRKTAKHLLHQSHDIDLVVARGGYRMVKTILNESTIPVLAHAAGGARIFVDKSANLSMAEKIIINSKVDKPAACNSLDTIIVHQAIAEKLLPKLVSSLRLRNVSVLGDIRASSITGIKRANMRDWDTEFLSLMVAIKTVKDVQEAIAFISQHGKRHTEGIIASNKRVIENFNNSVDAAALFVNCSTRLHDGYVFGLGSEMGIATGKLHARGPVGLKELTTYKWEIYGKGHIR